MHSQKKEELLVQLDNALKRKVEQKYKKQLRTQELVSQQSSKLIEHQKMKVNTRYEQQPSTRPIYASRSPLIYSNKEIETEPNKPAHNNSNKNKLGLSPNQTSKPNTQRELSYTLKVEEMKENQLKEYIKKLKGRNIMLQRELRQLKETIQQLENESKKLKRQQSQFVILKNHNNSLVKEIQYLRAKPVPKQGLKISQMKYIQQQLKKILILLNCSLILKDVKAQNFIYEAFRSINTEINQLIEDKSKISNKLNAFDIQNLMVKQSSSMFKKEVEILREQNEQLQDLIQDNCLRIQQLEQQSQFYEQQKRNLQGRYRQVIKQLEGIKKEFKYTIQASKSSRPKREKPCFINKEGLTDSTVVRFSTQADVQTDEIVIESYQFQQKIQQEQFKQQRNQHHEQVNIQQITYIAELQSSNLQNDIQRSQLQQQVIKMEQQIEELNKRVDRYRKEAVQLTTQLKNQQQIKQQLISQNAKKDQESIKRLKSMNQLRNQLDQQIEKFQIVNLNLLTEKAEKTIILTQRNNALNDIQRLKGFIQQYQEKNRALEKQFYGQKEQFEHQILKKIINMQQKWNNQRSSLLSQIKSKQTKFFESQKEYQIKITQLTSKIRYLQDENKNYKQKQQRIQDRQLQFVELRNTLTQKLNEVFNHQKGRDTLISNYEKIVKNFQEKIRDFDLETNKINQCIKYLQKSNEQLIQQTKKYQQIENNLLQKIDGMSRQIFAYKCDVQRLSFDSKNNAQLKEYFQQVSNELKSKLEQLLHQITKTENEKSQIIAKKLQIENKNQEISLKENQIIFVLEQKKRQNNALKIDLEHLASSYRDLEGEFLRKKQQMRQLDRVRTEQIALQTYDIERLMKQIKELRAKLQQMDSLRESKNYQSSEAQQRIMMLTQQNKSLIRQHQLLLQQIRMKQTNKQEDIYLNELKQKQYCMLLKKILILNQDNTDLINCDNFQELLQIGAQRIVAKKKHQRDIESNYRKTKINDYQYEINEPTKRYYIGTEISSSQEIFQPKTFGIGDEFLKTESNITKTQRDLESPRQFRFSLSPFEEKQKEKRTSRIISYFDPNQSNQLKTKSKIQYEQGSQF